MSEALRCYLEKLLPCHSMTILTGKVSASSDKKLDFDLFRVFVQRSLPGGLDLLTTMNCQRNVKFFQNGRFWKVLNN